MVILIIIYLALTIAIAFDLEALILALRWNRIRHGRSGIPVISLVIYAICTIFIPIIIWMKIVLFTILTIFHISCQWLLPAVDRYWFNGRSKLHRAVLGGKYRAVISFLDQGIDVNVKDNAGITPLHIAVEHGNIEIVDVLLAHGADNNAQDKTGATPLHKAVSYRMVDIVRHLLSSGADPNIHMEYDNLTPVDIAQHTGCDDIIRLFLIDSS